MPDGLTQNFFVFLQVGGALCSLLYVDAVVASEEEFNARVDEIYDRIKTIIYNTEQREAGDTSGSAGAPASAVQFSPSPLPPPAATTTTATTFVVNPFKNVEENVALVPAPDATPPKTLELSPQSPAPYSSPSTPSSSTAPSPPKDFSARFLRPGEYVVAKASVQKKEMFLTKPRELIYTSNQRLFVIEAKTLVLKRDIDCLSPDFYIEQVNEHTFRVKQQNMEFENVFKDENNGAKYWVETVTISRNSANSPLST